MTANIKSQNLSMVAICCLAFKVDRSIRPTNGGYNTIEARVL